MKLFSISTIVLETVLFVGHVTLSVGILPIVFLLYFLCVFIELYISPCISFARPDSLQLGIRAGKSLSETLTLEGLPAKVLKCKML